MPQPATPHDGCHYLLRRGNKSSSYEADKCAYQIILCFSTRNSIPLFLNLSCMLLFKYNCVHWRFLKHFLFRCLTSCSLSGNAYYMFPSHYCLNMCSAVDNYVHKQTVRIYQVLFSPPTKSLDTRLGAVRIAKGQLLQFWIHNPGRVTELKVECT